MYKIGMKKAEPQKLCESDRLVIRMDTIAKMLLEPCTPRLSRYGSIHESATN